MNDTFLTLPHNIINDVKNPLHKSIFEIKDNTRFKVFLYVLQKASVTFLTTKYHFGTFSLKSILSKNSFLFDGRNTKNKIKSLIEELSGNSFFEYLKITNQTVSFCLTDEYKKALEYRAFTKIELNDFKDCKTIRQSKIKLLCASRPKGYLNLYYLFNILNIPRSSKRKDSIRTIKNVFKSLNISVEYHHPKNQNVEYSPKDFKFTYDAKIKT